MTKKELFERIARRLIEKEKEYKVVWRKNHCRILGNDLKDRYRWFLIRWDNRAAELVLRFSKKVDLAVLNAVAFAVPGRGGFEIKRSSRRQNLTTYLFDYELFF